MKDMAVDYRGDQQLLALSNLLIERWPDRAVLDLSRLDDLKRKGLLTFGNPIETQRALAVINRDGGGQNHRRYRLHRISRAFSTT